MVHHYRDVIQCAYCKRIFPTESGTVLFPTSRIRCCLECNEMMHDKYASDRDE